MVVISRSWTVPGVQTRLGSLLSLCYWAADAPVHPGWQGTRIRLGIYQRAMTRTIVVYALLERSRAILAQVSFRVRPTRS